LEHDVEHRNADEAGRERGEGDEQRDPEREQQDRGALVIGVEEGHGQD